MAARPARPPSRPGVPGSGGARPADAGRATSSCNPAVRSVRGAKQPSGHRPRFRSATGQRTLPQCPVPQPLGHRPRAAVSAVGRGRLPRGCGAPATRGPALRQPPRTLCRLLVHAGQPGQAGADGGHRRSGHGDSGHGLPTPAVRNRPTLRTPATAAGAMRPLRQRPRWTAGSGTIRHRTRIRPEQRQPWTCTPRVNGGEAARAPGETPRPVRLASLRSCWPPRRAVGGP